MTTAPSARVSRRAATGMATDVFALRLPASALAAAQSRHIESRQPLADAPSVAEAAPAEHLAIEFRQLVIVEHTLCRRVA